jgi:hypothetical protein
MRSAVALAAPRALVRASIIGIRVGGLGRLGVELVGGVG